MPASINLRKLVLSPTGSIDLGFILREDLLLCSSYLPLGVPNWAVIYMPSPAALDAAPSSAVMSPRLRTTSALRAPAWPSCSVAEHPTWCASRLWPRTSHNRNIIATIMHAMLAKI
jgi:hypothetical protein